MTRYKFFWGARKVDDFSSSGPPFRGIKLQVGTKLSAYKNHVYSHFRVTRISKPKPKVVRVMMVKEFPDVHE